MTTRAQHLVKIYGEYQEEARLKVIECEKRHQEMATTVNLLENRVRCEEESSGRRLNKKGEALLPRSPSINR